MTSNTIAKVQPEWLPLREAAAATGISQRRIRHFIEHSGGTGPGFWSNEPRHMYNTAEIAERFGPGGDLEDAKVPTAPRKTPIQQQVKEAADELRGFDRKGLYEWAVKHGMDNRSAFTTFKKALAEVGIDYSAARASNRRGCLEDIRERATRSITLYSDAKASKQRFGITDRDGAPVWHGRFFDDDRDFNGEQSSGELAAAKKAVWLASKVKDAAGLEAIELRLRVDAEWLCWANAVFSEADEDRGGRARELGEAALRQNVLLRVEHVPGAENPADQYTVCTGYMRWNERDLTSLLDSESNE